MIFSSDAGPVPSKEPMAGPMVSQGGAQKISMALQRNWLVESLNPRSVVGFVEFVVNCCVWPPYSVTGVGATVIVTGGSSAMTAVSAAAGLNASCNYADKTAWFLERRSFSWRRARCFSLLRLVC